MRTQLAAYGIPRFSRQIAQESIKTKLTPPSTAGAFGLDGGASVAAIVRILIIGRLTCPSAWPGEWRGHAADRPARDAGDNARASRSSPRRRSRARSPAGRG